MIDVPSSSSLVSWKKKDHKAQALRSKLYDEINLRCKVKDGSLIAESSFYPVLACYLNEGLHFDFPIGIDELSPLMHRSICACLLKGGRVTERDLIHNLNAEAAKLAHGTEKSYLIVTDIRMMPLDVRVANRLVEDAVISFPRRIPKMIKVARDFIYQQESYTRLNPRASSDSGLRLVVVRISARTTRLAIDRGIRALDITRAFWNTGINRNCQLPSFGAFRPINQLLPGILFSVHDAETGSLIDTYWSHRSYEYAARHRADIMAKFMMIAMGYDRVMNRWVRRGSSKMRELIFNALLGYQDALDEPVAETCFLKLWSVFELLTGGSGVRGPARISRALFTSASHWLAEVELDLLLDKRNAAVHESSGLLPSEYELIFALKRQLEELLNFYFQAAKQGMEPEDVLDMLDTPTTELLRKQARKKILLADKFQRKFVFPARSSR